MTNQERYTDPRYAVRPLTDEEEEHKKRDPDLYRMTTMRIKLTDEERKQNNKMRNKIYREKNRDKVILIKKKYDDGHKEERRKYEKEYRIKNAEKLTEKIECECGSKTIYDNLHHHRKTKKHITYLKYQDELKKII